MKDFRTLVELTITKTLRPLLAAGVLLLGTGVVSTVASPARLAGRTTLAITYQAGTRTSVDLVGTALRPGVIGTADVEREKGRTKIKVHMHRLPNPQSLGSFYTTYLLWAVAPEGQAVNLAELPHSSDFDTEVTTSFQTFGLIVTAEPHSAVSLPSPMVLAENVAQKDTVGGFQTGHLEYSGATYDALTRVDVSRRDFHTPLLVLGAHRAVEIAKSAEADEYARADLQKAETDLGTLDTAWPQRGQPLPKDLASIARDVMRTAEHARSESVQKAEQARIANERNAANARVAGAMNEADRAKAQAAQSDVEANVAKVQAQQDRAASAQARADAQQAQASADQARMNEASALQQAEQARVEKDELQERLYTSISAILQTRREARGLIVSLSDVLFDFDRSTLTQGARERLSKLVGLLVAYPGSYRVTTEGHTDSVGTHEYNSRLSADRAASVTAYLLSAGLPPEKVGAAVGFAETQPVATNETAEGRQANRRVEIVISDLAHS
jgi:outer membrane protein OmpA-like peptidoglycan-associated protein